MTKRAFIAIASALGILCVGLSIAQVRPSGGGSGIASITAGTGISTSKVGGNVTVTCTAAGAATTGCVTTGAQTIAGAKTFTGATVISGTSGTPLLDLQHALASGGGALKVRNSNNTGFGTILWYDSGNTNTMQIGFGNSASAAPYTSSNFIFSAGTNPVKVVHGANSTPTMQLDSTGLASFLLAASGSAALKFALGARIDGGASSAANMLWMSANNTWRTDATFRGGEIQSGSNTFTGSSASTNLYKSNMTDGSSSVAHSFDTVATFSTAGAKLLQIKTGGTEKAYTDIDGSRWSAGTSTLRTCASGTEGLLSRDTNAGGTSGHRTRLCMCTSDGAGSPAYAWQNVVSGTVGTNSTCSD